MMMKHYSPETTTIDHLAKNCTLVAAREVTGRSDEEIIRAFLARGYKWNKGTYTSTYIGAIKDLGFTVEQVSVWKDGVSSYRDHMVMKDTGRSNMWGNPIFRGDRQDMTVGAFARKHKRGTFVVSDGGHAFVIRDGIVVDPNLERRGAMRRRKLRDAYRVVDAVPSKKVAATRLKRNADPMVRFAPAPFRAKLRPVESEARRYFNYNRQASLFDRKQEPMRLSEIVANTSYTRGDAAWDIRRGRLVVIAS